MHNSRFSSVAVGTVVLYVTSMSIGYDIGVTLSVNPIKSAIVSVPLLPFASV